MIPGSANPLLLASAVGSPAPSYQIERSLRFNSSDSAYLGATFGTPTDQDVFTLSMWVKRSALGSTQHLFGVSTNHSFGFTSGDALNLTFGGSSALTTTALFRDPSAWYHIVWTQNGTSHTIYVNNVSVGTATATSSVFNTAVAHQIGAGNTTNFFNGYLADVHFIDGQALDPTSFGEFDTNGVWQPKAYTGTYPGNSFHLDFADNSAATTAGIGKDVSGNGNDWTPVNLSVAAGAGNDSLVDTPTNYGTDTGAGGEVRGNYCTLNPLQRQWSGAGSAQNGNLEFQDATARAATGSFLMQQGKWYFEAQYSVIVSSSPDEYPSIGLRNGAPLGANVDASFPGYGVNGIGYDYSGALRNQGVRTVGYPSFSVSDILSVAYDADTGKVWFGKNGVWINSGDPANGTNPMATATWYANGALVQVATYLSAKATFNFGQRPFAYTAPSGFKALCTTNLASTTITTSGSYTGNGVADGPFVYLNGVPTAMTVNGNAVTFGTEADKLSNGFKVRTTSTTYNQNAVVYNYSITSTGDPFKRARAQSNP